MMKVKQCPICQRASLRVLKTYEFRPPEAEEYDESTVPPTYLRERLCMLFDEFLVDDPARFDVVFCMCCGFIFTNPRFSPEEIRTKYRVLSQCGYDKKRHQSQPAQKVDKRACRIYSSIGRLQKKQMKSLKVLDYGGGEGYNLRPFVADNLCYLIDYVEYDHVDGTEYLGTELNALPRDDELFNVILCAHVLEHVPGPIHLLMDLADHLADDGLLYVEVPLGCFSEWKDLYEPLTHVNFFSEESIFKCLDSAGLNLLSLTTDYQWVTHGKMWCINAVAGKRRENEHTKFKTTREQMNDWYYYFRPWIERQWGRLESKWIR